MKKLVLLLAVVFSVSLFSCGGSNEAAEAVDTVAVEEVDSVACDSAACDSAACDSVACDSVKA